MILFPTFKLYRLDKMTYSDYVYEYACLNHAKNGEAQGWQASYNNGIYIIESRCYNWDWEAANPDFPYDPPFKQTYETLKGDWDEWVNQNFTEYYENSICEVKDFVNACITTEFETLIKSICASKIPENYMVSFLAEDDWLHSSSFGEFCKYYTNKYDFNKGIVAFIYESDNVGHKIIFDKLCLMYEKKYGKKPPNYMEIL